MGVPDAPGSERYEAALALMTGTMELRCADQLARSLEMLRRRT
jgi:hypothetical protein